jgi:hypothetical protein
LGPEDHPLAVGGGGALKLSTKSSSSLAASASAFCTRTEAVAPWETAHNSKPRDAHPGPTDKQQHTEHSAQIPIPRLSARKTTTADAHSLLFILRFLAFLLVGKRACRASGSALAWLLTRHFTDMGKEKLKSADPDDLPARHQAGGPLASAQKTHLKSALLDQREAGLHGLRAANNVAL